MKFLDGGWRLRWFPAVDRNERDGEASLRFIKPAAHLGEHPGQMSFLAGGCESIDRTVTSSNPNEQFYHIEAKFSDMSALVERLRDVDGAEARVIAHLGSLDFTVEYVREDLESRYSDQDLESAYRLIMANQVTGDDFKELIDESFEAQTLFFENVVVLVFPSARYEAVFASFDRTETFPVLDLIDAADRS